MEVGFSAVWPPLYFVASCLAMFLVNLWFSQNEWNYQWLVPQNGRLALARWLRWLENHSVDQKFAGLIPGQDTCLGCGFVPQSSCMWEATNWCFSLSLLLSLLSSLSRIGEHVFEWELKKMAGYIRAAWRALLLICIYKIIPKLSANDVQVRSVSFLWVSISLCSPLVLWEAVGVVKRRGSLARERGSIPALPHTGRYDLGHATSPQVLQHKMQIVIIPLHNIIELIHEKHLKLTMKVRMSNLSVTLRRLSFPRSFCTHMHTLPLS